jgi:Xaa-Pro dipeptidase
MDSEIMDKQQRAMRVEGLDALIAISPENFAYAAGFVVPSQPLMRWRHAICVVNAGGRVAMVAVDMEATTVRAHTDLKEVRIYREFLDDPMEKLSELITDLHLQRARLGIEMQYLPAKDLMTLQRKLPDARFVAADHLFDRMRQVKTKGEIDLLRSLSKITDQAIGDSLRSARNGMTEMDLAGMLLSRIYAGGAENFRLMIIATGERSQYPNVGPTQRVLQEGDIIRMEIFGMKRGYHAGVCRTAVVGSPTEEQVKIWSNLTECKDRVMDLVRPGSRCQQIYERFLEKFGSLGFEPISFVGHGIGLFLHEEPYLGPHSDAVLEEGMVLGIEPLVYIPGRMGLQNKDMVAVTKDGCELLSDRTPTDELLRVG